MEYVMVRAQKGEPKSGHRQIHRWNDDQNPRDWLPEALPGKGSKVVIPSMNHRKAMCVYDGEMQRQYAVG